MSGLDQQQIEVFPPPPPWYKLYRPGADGSAERPLRPTPPDPPREDYESFGRLEPVETGIPPLSVKQLFHIQPNGTVDYKAELAALNKELIVQYVHFASTLVDRPSSYGRDVEAISVILRNMHFLLNCLRSHQARATLKYIMRTEAQDRSEAITELRQKRQRAQQILDDYQRHEKERDYNHRFQEDQI